MATSYRMVCVFVSLGVILFCLNNYTPRQRIATGSAHNLKLKWAIEDARFSSPVPIYSTAYSQNGRWLAGTGRGEVRIWQTSNGKTVRRIAFGDSAIGMQLSFHPDGQSIQVLAYEDVPYDAPENYNSHSWPVTVRRFDIASGKEMNRVLLERTYARQTFIRIPAAFTPDGNGVVLGGIASTPRRYNTSTGQLEWEAVLPNTNVSVYQQVHSLAISPNGKLVAAGISNSGGPFHLLNAETGNKICHFSEPTSDYSAVAFSGDGKLLATAGRGNEVVLWDLATNTPRTRVSTAPMANTPLSLSYHGDRLAVAEYDKGIRVYDTLTGRETACTEGQLKWPVVIFSPLGNTVVATALTGNLIVFDKNTGQTQGNDGFKNLYRPQFQFNNEETLVRISFDSNTKWSTFDLQTGRKITSTQITAPEKQLQSSSFWPVVKSTDEHFTAELLKVECKGEDYEIVVRDIVQNKELMRIPSNLSQDFRQPKCFSLDGKLLYTVGFYEVAVWDITTGKLVNTLAKSAHMPEKLGPFLSVALSPGNKYIAVFEDTNRRQAGGCGTCNASSPDIYAKTVTIWDTATWKVIREVLVPTGSWLLWQSDERFCVQTMARQPLDKRSPSYGLIFHRGDNLEEQMRFTPLPYLGTFWVEEWTVVEGKINTWHFQPPFREQLVLAPNGRLLAGFDPHDHTRPGVRIYAAETGQVLGRLPIKEPCRNAEFSPNGKFLITDHPGTGVMVWDVQRAIE